MNKPFTGDRREGKPSASAMTRIFNCPASFRLNVMEMPETSAAAEEGTKLHRIMELHFRPKTNDDVEELESLWHSLDNEQQEAIEFAKSFVRQNIIDGGDGESRNFHFEERLWSKSKLFSGRGDLVVFSKDRATIVDYKFGRGDVEPAESNYQLAAMAVLVNENFGSGEIEEVRAIIIQPRALDSSRRITECVYDKADIDAAREAINNACREALEASNPHQQCGYWCKYCPSAYRCKAAQDAINAQRTIAVSSPSLAITAANAKEIFEKAKFVKQLCDNMLAQVKTFVAQNPEAQCGLVLQEGAKRAKVGDAAKVFQAIEEVGIDAEEFVGTCSVSITKLSDLYYQKRKQQNDRITRRESYWELNETLEQEGLLEYKQNQPTLSLEDEK